MKRLLCILFIIGIVMGLSGCFQPLDITDGALVFVPDA